MLTSLLIIASIFLFIIAPLMTLLRYYKPSEFSVLMNLALIGLTILTWPLVPLIIATRRRDKLLLSMFWVFLLVWIVSLVYWLVLNVDQFIELQHQLAM